MTVCCLSQSYFNPDYDFIITTSSSLLPHVLRPLSTVHSSPISAATKLLGFKKPAFSLRHFF
jgi:hypothetical protein